MAEHWCKVSCDLDNHPKIRKAGFLGSSVFQFALRRNAKPSNPVPGMLTSQELEPWFIADQTGMSVEQAETGVTAAVTCGLLERDGLAWRICGWNEDWGKRAMTVAERVSKYRSARRAAHQLSDSTVASNVEVTIGNGTPLHVTPSNGCNAREERRGDRDIRPPSRAHRCPENWTPSRSDATVKAETDAQKRGVNLANELDKLRDWSKAQGANGKKTDWDATWRNWLRNAKATQPVAAQKALRMYDDEAP